MKTNPSLNFIANDLARQAGNFPDLPHAAATLRVMSDFFAKEAARVAEPAVYCQKCGCDLRDCECNQKEAV